MSDFKRHYGFLCKPQRIRFRILGRQMGCGTLNGMADVQLDAAGLARLKLPGERVFITENEINFLAFPSVEGSVVIFGQGYGAHSQP